MRHITQAQKTLSIYLSADPFQQSVNENTYSICSKGFKTIQIKTQEKLIEKERKSEGGEGF